MLLALRTSDVISLTSVATATFIVAVITIGLFSCLLLLVLCLVRRPVWVLRSILHHKAIPLVVYHFMRVKGPFRQGSSTSQDVHS